MFGPDPGTAAAIGTGRREIDRYLEGIGLGSLLLVEGKHASGKSVLCQHLAHHALGAGLGVAYYTSEEPSPRLSFTSSARWQRFMATSQMPCLLSQARV